MKTVARFFLAFGLAAASAQAPLQPYLQLGELDGPVQDQIDAVTSRLESAGLQVLGGYQPAEDPDRYVLAVTSGGLLSATAKGQPTAGFAAAMRVALTQHGEHVAITSQNPVYWGNAYFQDDYEQASAEVLEFAGTLVAAFNDLNGGSAPTFGSAQDFSAKDLRGYHYMFAMPYFKDMVELGSFASFEEAVGTIENNLASSAVAQKVFEVQVPGKEVRLYGISLRGENGEGRFLPIIDLADQKHTASMPYGLLVMEGEVVMLHGRYRIALSFPDLTMGTFTKIMSTPGHIKEMMKTLTQ